MTDIIPFPSKKKPLDIPLGQPTELVVHAVKDTAMRCRLLSTGEPVTLKAVNDEVEGEIITAIPSKVWQFKKTTYMTGEVMGRKFDIPALNLTPLKLEDMGEWDPNKHEDLMEDRNPFKKYYLPIIAYGKRQSYEMEQIYPFGDPEDFDSDPIFQAVDAYGKGDYKKAYKIIAEILTVDLRCIDAHAHLGNWHFDSKYDESVKRAMQHYETGKRIAELSLGNNFQDVLLWGLIDNRPYLRCLHGYGLCLWRLGKAKEAYNVFERMLWLNPMDNQGMRMLLMDIDEGKDWVDEDEEVPISE